MERERTGVGYTVHELAELSGCTVRTLHHYDDLGLVPAQRANNGYRRYGAAEVDRAASGAAVPGMRHAACCHRALLDDPAFDARDALAGHLRELHARKRRLDGLIASVEKTLACMEGSATMEDEEKFEAFKQGLVDENEQRYGKEVRERWGDDAADASNAKLMGMSVEQYRQTQKLEQGVKDALAAAMAAGDPTGEDAHRAADLHRQWLCEFWKDGTYSKAAHLGLAEMYVADDRFKAYYEAVAPGAAEFLRDASRRTAHRNVRPVAFRGGGAPSSLAKHASAPNACFTSEDA